MKKDGIQTRNRKLSAKVGADRSSIRHFQTFLLLISLASELLFPLKSFAQSKKKRAGMADFFRNGLDGRWGMGMGENKN